MEFNRASTHRHPPAPCPPGSTLHRHCTTRAAREDEPRRDRRNQRLEAEISGRPRGRHSRWARICSRKQNVLANRTVYRSGPTKRGVQEWTVARTARFASAPPRRRGTERTRGAADHNAASVGDRHDLAAEATAQIASAGRPDSSPGVRRGEQVEYPVARAERTAVSQRGRSPNSASAITGASTDDTATMKPSGKGVVITSPAVWRDEPDGDEHADKRRPRLAGRGGRRYAPCPGSRGPRCRSGQSGTRTASRSARALFTATKLVPHSAVASRQRQVRLAPCHRPVRRSSTSLIAAVGESGCRHILGRPCATTRPPRSPASRSISITQSARFTTSRWCSMTIRCGRIDEPVEHATGF